MEKQTIELRGEMKKLYLICGILLACLICGSALADVSIDAVNFPDELFRAYVSRMLDADRDGFLSNSEISQITDVDVLSEGITSVQDIEYFAALTYLECGSNKLTSLLR